MSEQDKWDAFEASRNKRLEAHKNNMAEGCKGCNIGRIWLIQDYVNLCEAMQPGVTLEKLSLELDRPIFGIANKLAKIGLIKPRRSYYDLITQPIPRFYIERRWPDKELMLEALKSAGWYYQEWEKDGKVVKSTQYLYPPESMLYKFLKFR